MLLAAALSHRYRLRVGIAAQTRAQAIDIARRARAAVCDHPQDRSLWGSLGHQARCRGFAPGRWSGTLMWPDSGGMVRVAAK